MANNPSFSFYVNDFEGGTRHMTDTELGCYVRLLLAQFNRGDILPNDANFLKRFCTSFDESWPIVKEKFKPVGENQIQNKRLSKESAKRSKFIDKQSNNGRKGGRPQNPDKSQIESQKKTKVKPIKNPIINPVITQSESQKKPLGNGIGKGNGYGIGEGNWEGSASPEIKKVSMPFNGTFEIIWLEWKDYKFKQHQFKFKSEGSEQASLHEIVSLASGVEDVAIAIIHQSMAKGWKGFFPLKIENNGTAKQPTGAGVSVQSILSKINSMPDKS